MKTYHVTLTGKTPLLMHNDDIEWADLMTEWKDNPANKKHSKAGDDRTPAWRWVGALYHDGEYLAMPSDNCARCSMEGGAMVPVPGGKNGKTFKAQTQSGMQFAQPFLRFTNFGRQIPMADIKALMKIEDFAKMKTMVNDLGFTLFIKRAKIGASKHIRVRPRFDNWMVEGDVVVHDSQLTQPILEQVFTYGGQYKGLGDWRPGSRTPGHFGMFEAAVR